MSLSWKTLLSVRLNVSDHTRFILCDGSFRFLHHSLEWLGSFTTFFLKQHMEGFDHEATYYYIRWMRIVSTRCALPYLKSFVSTSPILSFFVREKILSSGQLSGSFSRRCRSTTSRCSSPSSKWSFLWGLLLSADYSIAWMDRDSRKKLRKIYPYPYP